MNSIKDVILTLRHCAHQTIKGIRFMSKQAGPEAAVSQIWMPGADSSYAATHGWIRQTVATGKTFSPPVEAKVADGGELAGTPLLVSPAGT
jgi:hypothetical protein